MPNPKSSPPQDENESARDSEPLVPVPAKQPLRQPGSLQGQVMVSDSFFDPLPSAELDAWAQ